MGRLGFLMIVIALAAVGFSSGASNVEYCDDKVLCKNKPKIYDEYQQHMDEIVNQSKALISNKLFNSLEGDMYPVLSGDDQNCMAETTVEKPFVIKSNNTSEIVVQSAYFEQKIRMTRCKRPQSPCFTKVKFPGFGIKTYCEEKFGGVSLYIYDPEMKKIRYKMFEVPVCCVCKMKVQEDGDDEIDEFTPEWR